MPSFVTRTAKAACFLVFLAMSTLAFTPTKLLVPRSVGRSPALKPSTSSGLVAIKAQLRQEAKDPLKDERGNNIGDLRYTTTYDEDLKLEVEDLPAGTTSDLIREIAARLKDSGLPQTQYSGKIKYRNHVVGSEVVDWMLKERIAKDRRVAVAYGRMLIREAEIIHCSRGHDFKDEPLFYRFVSAYEKGLIDPKTPYDYMMRVLTNPPILFAGVFVFLVVANVVYVLQGGKF